MSSPVDNYELNKLDINVRSSVKMGGLIFPLSVHIKDIKNDTKDISDHNVYTIEKEDSVEIIYDKTADYYKKFYEDLEFHNNLKVIHGFLDKDIVGKYIMDINKNIYAIDFDLGNEKDFIDFIISSGLFSAYDIYIALKTIQRLVGKVRNDFMKKAIALFEVDKKFPEIKLTKKNNTPQDWIKAMSYNMNMLSLQAVAELPMDIWFPENVGKAYYEWSWREQELKRLFVTMKTRIENFRELVKSKQMEESMEESKKKNSGGKNNRRR